MRKSIASAIALLLLATTLQACSTGGSGSSTTGSTAGGSSETSEIRETIKTSESKSTTVSESTSEDETTVIQLEFDFNHGDEGFEAGFSDLPIEYNDEIYGLDSGIKELPEELGEGQGFYITGMNRSDDLFMFLTKELGQAEGIVANQDYEIKFEIEFGSNAFANSFGIGGSPAESVYLKAGASSIKPEAIEGEEGDTPMYWMNIDKGQQSEGGEDAKVIGNIAKQDGSEDDLFALVEANSEAVELSASSDAEGRIFLIVGTDSAFEGTTELYYTKITVTLTAVD